MRNILAIGAYERDNFGDYLFLEVLKRSLPEDNVIPGSILSSDMRQEYGLVTIPYDFVLDNYKVDAVWVVGGEVGGVAIPNALDITLGLGAGVYERINYAEAKQIETLFGVSRKHAQAYIPDISIYPNNKDTPLIVNSVGIKGMNKNSRNSQNLFSLAKAIVVRDVESYDKLRPVVPDIRLSPDVVHALSYYYTPTKEETRGCILLQINATTVSNNGVESVQKMLKAIHDKYGRPIRLFSAGIAVGHDSVELYDSVKRGLDGVDIEILQSRKPLDIVDYIASADLVIATSLHVRIIAATYGVCRVSLCNDKVTRYAQKWDSDWPFDIDIVDVIDELTAIKLGEDRPTLKRTNLAQQSYDTLQKLITLLPVNQDGEAKDINELLNDWHAQQQKIAYSLLTGNHHDIAMQAAELAHKDDLIARQQKELDTIKSSKAWRIVERYRNMRSGLGASGKVGKQ